MTDTIRAFIAFELPEKTILSIRRVQEGLKTCKFKIRWVKPENIHLTLKFLGNIHVSAIEKIKGALFEAVKGFKPIPLSVKGIGSFPGIRRPRVVWMGLGGGREILAQFQIRVDKEMERLGYSREKRPFKGHLTFGRVKSRVDPIKFSTALIKHSTFESETFFAESVILFQSELKPEGAVYTKLADVPLVG